MTVKPVEEMTREEVAAELERVRAARADLDSPREKLLEALDLPQEGTEWGKLGEAEVAKEQGAEQPAWPHLTMEYAGQVLEVRKPDESALVAVSMTGTPGLSPQTQMRIFTKFLVNHLSPESFVTVVEAMTDPESGVNIQGLITALTKL